MVTSDDFLKQTSVQGILEKVLDALHDVGGSFYVKRMLDNGKLTSVLRERLEKKVFTSEQIEEYVLSTWENAVMRLNELKKEGKG
jgi:hypothetical protein